MLFTSAWRTCIKTFIRRDTGATALEYSLIAALIVAVVLLGIQFTGTSLEDLMTDSISDVSTAMNSATSGR